MSVEARDVYRISDVVAHEEQGICYVYLRNHEGRKFVTHINAVFEIAVGQEYNCGDIISLTEYCTREHMGKVTMQNLGTRNTYYRGEKEIVLITCASFKVYDAIHKKLEYGGFTSLFLCDSYDTVEDITLHRAGLYGELYITHDPRTNKLVPVKDFLETGYKPLVAAFDLEMLALNPANEKSEPYMASYYFCDHCYLIYATDFYSAQVQNTSKITYIKVPTCAQVVLELVQLMVRTNPDVVVGYNIYYADLPIIKHTMLRHLQLLKFKDMRPPMYFHNTSKIARKYIESELGTALKIPGVQIVDMYSYLIRTLPPNDQDNLKLGDVGLKYLGRAKDPLTYLDLQRIYQNGTDTEKLSVMHYCAKDSELARDLYIHFNAWNFHVSTTKLCGVFEQRIMSKGKVDTTYGLCSKLCKSIGTFMDYPNSRIFRPSGGEVIDPEVGSHQNVHCIDLTSLYPSIVMQHNIDATSVIRFAHKNYKPLTESEVVSYYRHNAKLNMDILVGASRNDDGTPRFIYGFNLAKPGIMPRVLDSLLSRRAELKRRIAAAQKEGRDEEAKLLSGEEQAVKISANSACGAWGEQTDGNPLSSCELNDVITTTGRRILLTAVDRVRELGVRVIYGDTDSLFLDLEDKVTIDQVLDYIHEVLPPRIRFKHEYKAELFTITSKKCYISRIDGKIKIAGYKSAKTSSCKVVRIAFQKFVEDYYNLGMDAAQENYNSTVEKYLDPAAVDGFAFARNFSYKGADYKSGTSRAITIEAMKSRNVELMPGSTLLVVTVLSHDSYVHLRGKNPPIILPQDSKLKSPFVYTLDEIGSNFDVIDVCASFTTPCLSDIRSIIRAHHATADKQ